MNWIPLHCHSQYSILDSTSSISSLVGKAAEFKIPALALTDHGNLYGAVPFYKECVKRGIKPIVGAELYIAPNSRFEKKKEKHRRVAHHLILLCKNDTGYRNLCKLSSLAFTEGFYYFPRIDKELLQEHHEGLICLSACLSGSIPQAALLAPDSLEAEILWFKDLFKEDFYLELQLHEMSDDSLAKIDEEWLRQEHRNFVLQQKQVNKALIAASKKLAIPVVATNDIHYINPEDWLAHEILLNIQSGETIRTAKQNTYISNPKRKFYSSREYYFKSPEEMATIFSDIPEAISNTALVAEKCNLKLDFDNKHYPIYVPEELKNKSYTEQERYDASAKFLRKLCEEGLKTKYSPEALEYIAKKFPDKDPMSVVKERLESEMSVIIPKGMCDYLLIVWDIIHWAKANGIPVGPGRGSGAGSVMLFLMGITEIEPIRFDLFFERFINPERISYPDIDIDICMSGRENVINYTLERHGRENVAQIITFGTMKAKMAIKDVGRTLDIPLSKVNTIAKHIPDLNTTLEKALEIDPDLNHLYTHDPDATQIIDMALKLEGSIRNTGVHAAGVIICGEKLIEKIPICISKDSSMITTQYSMKPVESVGMLKVDFLGLKTLTSIQLAINSIYKKTGIQLSISTLPLNDQKTFALLHQGKTLGIFQMESKGMQELAKNLRPDTFEEIIAIGALYRPGPMDMIPSFINRKFGKEVIEYDHPLMEPILKETFGIMVYQEQVMQIAGSLANYSLGEGDVLRRAMGKKDAEQMVQERTRFCERACSKGIDPQLATTIFDKMEKFASYGFNKSHAAAYGLITYTTAFLKANYPKEWMAALLTSDRDDIEKVGKLIREVKTMEIAVLPPDINESDIDFVATDQGIRFALTGIKGVGKGVVESILEERQRQGPYKDIYDFISRSDLKKVSKKTIECLTDSGCFDFSEPDRDKALALVEAIYESVAKEKKEAASGVMTFFSLETMQKGPPSTIQKDLSFASRSKRELLKKEKELLGIYLTEHPLDAIKHLIPRLSGVPFSEFENLPHAATVRTTFIIDKVVTKISSKGQKRFAVLRVSDGEDSIELPVWPELYEEKQSLLEEDRLIYAILTIDRRGGESLRLHCKWMADLSTVNESVIAECDEFFEKVKIQMQKVAYMASQASNTTEKKPTPSMKKRTTIFNMDLRQIRHSHIVTLKDLIQNHSGDVPLKLVFTKEDVPVGTISPDENFYVSEDLESLSRELESLGLPVTVTKE
ncbi:DNA polymerase III subunit alpha [Chlamydiifrater phoenicopteri]|uniref:DNA polymerase III subunit alpha n=1 Tax=Chlamydiifrater phoenicopteri TaxID=2681469 RepID=UPI001BCF135E|nr:DNA polymerase III subunit alpha [Chlamydiifrater phoenicopteri]